MIKYTSGALAGLILSAFALAYAQPGANSGNWGVIESGVPDPLTTAINCPAGDVDCLVGNAGSGAILNLGTDGELNCTDNAGTGHCSFCFSNDCNEYATSTGSAINIGVNAANRYRFTETYLQTLSGQGIQPGSKTSDPCGTLPEGVIFYNDTSNYMCYCDGTNDVQLHDPATACF